MRRVSEPTNRQRGRVFAYRRYVDELAAELAALRPLGRLLDHLVVVGGGGPRVARRLQLQAPTQEAGGTAGCASASDGLLRVLSGVTW